MTTPHTQQRRYLHGVFLGLLIAGVGLYLLVYYFLKGILEDPRPERIIPWFSILFGMGAMSVLAAITERRLAQFASPLTQQGGFGILIIVHAVLWLDAGTHVIWLGELIEMALRNEPEARSLLNSSLLIWIPIQILLFLPVFAVVGVPIGIAHFFILRKVYRLQELSSVLN